MVDKQQEWMYASKEEWFWKMCVFAISANEIWSCRVGVGWRYDMPPFRTANRKVAAAAPLTFEHV